ncbi:MAG: site-specific integrase [Rhodothermales bacterium]|nr:site-specific integrase [Rhodothermales bacterium]
MKKVTEDHIRDHITKGRTIGFTDKGCLSEPSLSLHLRHLRTFFNHFKGNGELTSNPIDGIKFDSPRRNLDVLRRDTPTGSDWDTLFDHVKTKVLPQTERPPTYLIHCLMRTGCRVGELIDLKWNPTEPYETLDGGNKPSYSYLTPSMDKMVIYSKRVLRSIDVSHLTDDVFKQLKTRFPQNKTYVFGNPNSVKNRRMDKDSGLPYYRSNIRRQFKVFLKECGLPPYPLHSLRRGFITRQVDNTQNIVQIGEYVGHTSTYMTEHYTRTDEQLQRVLVQGF